MSLFYVLALDKTLVLQTITICIIKCNCNRMSSIWISTKLKQFQTSLHLLFFSSSLRQLDENYDCQHPENVCVRRLISPFKTETLVWIFWEIVRILLQCHSLKFYKIIKCNKIFQEVGIWINCGNVEMLLHLWNI